MKLLSFRTLALIASSAYLLAGGCTITDLVQQLLGGVLPTA